MCPAGSKFPQNAPCAPAPVPRGEQISPKCAILVLKLKLLKLLLLPVTYPTSGGQKSIPNPFLIVTMEFFLKNVAILNNFHQIWPDWSPFHDQNSILVKKYFPHETALESRCDLHSTTEMTGKKLYNFAFCHFFQFVCQFFHMFGIVSS